MMTSMLALMTGIVASSASISGTPPVEGRYWRILVIENYSRGSVAATSADNIQMRATPGGTNLATTPANAISDSEFSGSFLNDYAFNGANGQFWVSLNTGGSYGTHWIGYDFGTPVEIQEITWSKRPDTYGRNEAPVIGIVQYSTDGLSWATDWAFVTPATWGTGAETRTFTKNTDAGYLFWRLRPTSVQGGSSSPFSTAELEFRNAIGGADQTTGGLVISGVFNNGTYPASRAFDDITTGGANFALASGNTPASGSWIGYAFISPKDIVQILYQVRGDAFGANEALTAGDIQYSEDTLTWTTYWSLTSPATWVNNSTESRVFTKP